VDEILSISDIYFNLLNVMRRGNAPKSNSNSGMIGLSWATSGGESSAIFNDKYLAADGIENVTRVLDQLENGNISSLEFIELNACPGGCVGGVMAPENPFVAKARLQTLRRYLPVSRNFVRENGYIPDEYFFQDMPTYRPLQRLSENFGESLRMMSDIQKLRDSLPGIDCGACGAPTCRAFAEDVVMGRGDREGCLVEKARKTSQKRKEQVKKRDDQ
jgi:hypothetical protein